MACLALVAAGGCCAPAKANLVIDPVWANSISSDPNAATIEGTIDTAISNFETDISNPVTVYINFTEATSGLGGSNTTAYVVPYSNYLNGLENNQILSLNDSTALNSLGLTAPYTAPNPTTNPVNGSTSIETSGPLLRALGLGALASATSSASSPDSTINFNTNLVYDSLGTPPAGKYSLEAVVSHEIDEVLGIGGQGSMLNNVVGGYTAANGAVGTTDLFRYSAYNTRSYTTAAGADPYFSIDSGATNLDYFNQSAIPNTDYGDWGNGITGSGSGNTPPQVQDAFGAPGIAPSLGRSEMTALDVVGWNLTAQGAALEQVNIGRATWIGGVGNWDNASNWTGGIAPVNGPASGISWEVNVGFGTCTVVNGGSSPVEISTLNFSGGTLNVTTPFTIDSTFTWTAGMLAGGTTSANGGLTITTSSNAAPTLSNGNLDVGTTASFLGTGYMEMNSGAVLTNLGTVSVATSGFAGIVNDGVGSSAFVNSGIFNNNNTGGDAFVIQPGVTFSNSNTVNVQSGELWLEGGDGSAPGGDTSGGSTTGSFVISSGAYLALAGSFYLGPRPP